MRMGLDGGGTKATKEGWEQKKYSSLEEHTPVGYWTIVILLNKHASNIWTEKDVYMYLCIMYTYIFVCICMYTNIYVCINNYWKKRTQIWESKDVGV